MTPIVTDVYGVFHESRNNAEWRKTSDDRRAVLRGSRDIAAILLQAESERPRA